MAKLTERLKSKIDKKTSASLLNKQLGLENLKRHSFQNQVTGNTFESSSVLSGSVQDERLNGGKPTLIPFLYDGRILSGPEGGREAVQRAVDSGLVFPAFDTNDEATVASKKLSSRIGREK